MEMFAPSLNEETAESREEHLAISFQYNSGGILPATLDLWANQKLDTPKK